MSNKTQLQTNNTKYASLIETLRGKAAGSSGEDVTDETNAYTTKLASLETAIAALETELEGKASGGSGGGASVETCTVELSTSAGHFSRYAYSCIEDGQIRSLGVDETTATSIVLNNVICGSYIFISNSSLVSAEQASGVEMLLNDAAYWRVTAGGGETAVLKFWSPF